MLRSAICSFVVLALVGVNSLRAEDEAEGKPTAMSLADDKVTLTAPAAFVSRKPTVNFIAYEFSAPMAEGDERDGRLTVSTASGGVEANIDRWLAQFTQPDGKPTKDRTEIKKETIGGQEVHLVDITGTYLDRPPFNPAAPSVKREGYRMLAAIIVTEKNGQHFLKFYGPAKTVAAHEEAFGEMVKSLKVAE
jgi:hypothetical protein